MTLRDRFSHFLTTHLKVREIQVKNNICIELNNTWDKIRSQLSLFQKNSNAKVILKSKYVNTFHHMYLLVYIIRSVLLKTLEAKVPSCLRPANLTLVDSTTLWSKIYIWIVIQVSTLLYPILLYRWQDLYSY